MQPTPHKRFLHIFIVTFLSCLALPPLARADAAPILDADEQAAADAYLARHGENAIGQYIWENRRHMRTGSVRRHLTYFHSKGADIEARKNNVGNTPLHWATIENGGVEIAKLLVSLGADVQAKNNNGFSPLHFAAGDNQNLEITKCLISLGADVNAREHSSGPPRFALRCGKTPTSKSSNTSFPRARTSM